MKRLTTLLLTLLLAACNIADDAFNVNSALLNDMPAPVISTERRYLALNDVITLTVENPKEDYTYYWELSGGGIIDPVGTTVEYTAPPKEAKSTIYCYGLKKNRYKTVVSELKVESIDFISGNVLWLKADSLSSLNDGARVSRWSDSSGTGNHFVEPFPEVISPLKTALPIYKADGFKGKPSVRFTGNEMLIKEEFQGLIFRKQATIFIVFKNSSLADYTYIIGSHNNVYTFPNLHLLKSNNEGYGMRCLTWDQGYMDFSMDKITTGQVYHYSMSFDGTIPEASRDNRVTVRLNGADQNLAVRWYAWNSTGIVRTMTLGNFMNPYGKGSCWSGDIAEIIIFDHLLTPEKYSKIEKYLIERWGN